MSSSIETDINKLRDDLTQLRGDVAALVASLKEAALADGTLLNGVRHRADSIQKELEQDLARGKKHIEERPLTSVAASFAVGMILGALFSRKN